MNKQMQKQSGSMPAAVATLADQELLTQCGFPPEESASLLWLRQWYQTGGSDRALIVRHLEFVRLLVHSGALEI